MAMLFRLRRTLAHRLCKALGRAVTRLSRTLDDHWIGDLLGVLCLFGGLWGLLVLGCGMGWK